MKKLDIAGEYFNAVQGVVETFRQLMDPDPGDMEGTEAVTMDPEILKGVGEGQVCYQEGNQVPSSTSPNPTSPPSLPLPISDHAIKILHIEMTEMAISKWLIEYLEPRNRRKSCMASPHVLID